MILDNNIYSVLTPTGFQNFEGLAINTHTNYLQINFTNGNTIKCSNNHRFFVDEYNTIFANELVVGSIIVGDDSLMTVQSIVQINDKVNLYDLFSVNEHKYYTQGILSHNCDCDFISSGHTVIPSTILQWYTDTHVKDPIQTRGANNDVWIWKFVDYTKSYVITADIARGDGADFSTFHIFDIETLEQVAEYKGQIGTREFGNMLVAYGHEYNTALIVPENKNVGWDTVQQIIDLKYPNLYYSFKSDPFLDPSIHLAKSYDLKDRKDMVPGFTTTPSTRPAIVSKLQLYFEQKIPIIHSKRLIAELYVFMWIEGKPQAQRGYHDDLVIPCGIMFFIRDTTIRLRQIGIDLTKKTLNSTHKLVHKPTIQQNSNWEQRTARGTVEKLNWLL